VIAMPTLYVRNLPPELYEQLKEWAATSGRSVNAEVISLLEAEAARRGPGDWLENLKRLAADIDLPEDVVQIGLDAIRAHRDAG
jgi:plasmid stability protein